jgi:hypothetical protein
MQPEPADLWKRPDTPESVSALNENRCWIASEKLDGGRTALKGDAGGRPKLRAGVDEAAPRKAVSFPRHRGQSHPAPGRLCSAGRKQPIWKHDKQRWQLASLDGSHFELQTRQPQK